jgi:hypothetical protein
VSAPQSPQDCETAPGAGAGTPGGQITGSWAIERGCQPTEEEIRERLARVPLEDRRVTKTDLLRLIGLDHLRGARRRRAVVVIQRVWPEVLLEVALAVRQEADEHQREVSRLAEELADTRRGAALASEQHAAVTEAWGVTQAALDAARAERDAVRAAWVAERSESTHDLERLREERDEWRSRARVAGVRLTALESVEQALRVQHQTVRTSRDRCQAIAGVLGVVVVAASVLAALASVGVL